MNTPYESQYSIHDYHPHTKSIPVSQLSYYPSRKEYEYSLSSHSPSCHHSSEAWKNYGYPILITLIQEYSMMAAIERFLFENFISFALDEDPILVMTLKKNLRPSLTPFFFLDSLMNLFCSYKLNPMSQVWRFGLE